MALKGRKAEHNLKNAFAGESQANRRYLSSAAKADVEGYNAVAAVSRSNAEKTSSVHFLRFQLSPAMVAAVKSGAAIGFGIDHNSLNATIAAVNDACRASLASDLQ